MELRDLDPSGVGLHSLPLRGRCHGDAVTEGAPCRRLGSHPASFGLISRRICRCLFLPLRLRLHGLGSLRMSRVGIAARTFRCYGIDGVWVVGFCWVGLEGFVSRMEKSNTFRSFVKIRPRGFAYAGHAQSPPSLHFAEGAATFSLGVPTLASPSP